MEAQENMSFAEIVKVRNSKVKHRRRKSRVQKHKKPNQDSVNIDHNKVNARIDRLERLIESLTETVSSLVNTIKDIHNGTPRKEKQNTLNRPNKQVQALDLLQSELLTISCRFCSQDFYHEELHNHIASCEQLELAIQDINHGDDEKKEAHSVQQDPPVVFPSLRTEIRHEELDSGPLTPSDAEGSDEEAIRHRKKHKNSSHMETDMQQTLFDLEKSPIRRNSRARKTSDEAGCEL